MPQNVKMFIGLMIVLGILYIPWKIRYEYRLENWSQVKATVTSVRLKKTGRGIKQRANVYKCVYTLKFEYKDQIYTDEKLETSGNSFGCDYLVGEQFQVLVNPNNPRKLEQIFYQSK